MRRTGAGLGGLALVLVGGCFTAAPGRPAGLVERLKPFVGPRVADAVVLHVALIEQPVGDRYLNDGLWAAADEQVIDLERKAVLDDNGFRVGLVGGIPPAELQALLTSERSCSAHQVQMRAGDPKPLPLGGPRPQLNFQLHADGKAAPVALEQAQCVLQLTPALTPGGEVKLAFLPVVQHGAKAVWPLPVDGAVPLAVQRPTERYPALGWEVALGGGYLVVGTRFAKDETLGHRYFVSTEGPRPVQRLLVIRASRLAPADAAPEAADAARAPAVPPLALRAVTTIRGTGE